MSVEEQGRDGELADELCCEELKDLWRTTGRTRGTGRARRSMTGAAPSDGVSRSGNIMVDAAGWRDARTCGEHYAKHSPKSSEEAKRRGGTKSCWAWTARPRSGQAVDSWQLSWDFNILRSKC